MIWAGYYSLQSGRSWSGADLGGECRAYANPPEMMCGFLDTPLIVITECRGFSLICFAND